MAQNKRPGSNKATGRNYDYDKEYQSTPERKKYRAELNKANRKDGTAGNGDKMDKSHTKSGKLVNEAQSKNRARNRGKK
jgi:hypothetical protein